MSQRGRRQRRQDGDGGGCFRRWMGNGGRELHTDGHNSFANGTAEDRYRSGGQARHHGSHTRKAVRKACRHLAWCQSHTTCQCAKRCGRRVHGLAKKGRGEQGLEIGGGRLRARHPCYGQIGGVAPSKVPRRGTLASHGKDALIRHPHSLEPRFAGVEVWQGAKGFAARIERRERNGLTVICPRKAVLRRVNRQRIMFQG